MRLAGLALPLLSVVVEKDKENNAEETTAKKAKKTVKQRSIRKSNKYCTIHFGFTWERWKFIVLFSLGLVRP